MRPVWPEILYFVQSCSIKKPIRPVEETTAFLLLALFHRFSTRFRDIFIFCSSYCVIVRVRVVLKRTVVGD